MSVHSDFILAPVSDILCDTSTITHSMSWGIEMYPLWDNIMQSIFMKMTGAQEQKMKCICWEIATIDFDLRRDIYFPWKLNECSQIADKIKVLNFLRKAIVKLKKDFDFSTIDTNEIWNSTKDVLDEFHANTNSMGFCERDIHHRAEFRFLQPLVGILDTPAAQYFRHTVRYAPAGINRPDLSSSDHLKIQVFACGIVIPLAHGIFPCLFATASEMLVALRTGYAF